MSVHCPLVWYAGDQERVSDPLEFEFQAVASFLVGAGNHTWVILESSQCFNCWATSPTLKAILNRKNTPESIIILLELKLYNRAIVIKNKLIKMDKQKSRPLESKRDRGINVCSYRHGISDEWVKHTHWERSISPNGPGDTGYTLTCRRKLDPCSSPFTRNQFKLG